MQHRLRNLFYFNQTASAIPGVIHTDESADRDDRPSTAPDSFTISARGFSSEDEARSVGEMIGVVVRALSKPINLSRLDGVTVAWDYSAALQQLDRGIPTNTILTPSDGEAVGIAMTPTVLRDGRLKSHIVLNAAFMTAIVDPKLDGFDHALHTIAHECAHVEINGVFDEAFPEFLLCEQSPNALAGSRWSVILACWDEFAASYIGGAWGRAPTDGYEEVFLKALASTRDQANGFIKEYRFHGDASQVFGQVWEAYRNLLKYAAYLLGDLEGRQVEWSTRASLAKALEAHWFTPYFERLHVACRGILADYGTWPDRAAFERVGDIAEDLVLEGGIKATVLEDGGLYIDVPFTKDTMPI